MLNDQTNPSRSGAFREEVNARLAEATKSGRSLELIFAVRGRVEPVSGKYGARWRIRTGDGHVVSFRPEFVVAFDGTATNDRRPAAPAVPVAIR